MPCKFAFDISYVGNTSRHYAYVQELEQLPLGLTTSTNILSTVNNVSAAILPYKGYSSINFTRFGAQAAYNGLQVKVLRRFSDRFTINADYTWSKAIDLEDTDNEANTIPDYTQLHKFYAPAGFDRRNAFNFQYVYNLPDSAATASWYSSPRVDGVFRVTYFGSGSPCLNGYVGGWMRSDLQRKPWKWRLRPHPPGLCRWSDSDSPQPQSAGRTKSHVV